MHAEMLGRHDLHITRKIWHVVVGLIGLSLYYLTSLSARDIGVTLFAFGVLALIFDLLRLRIHQLNKFAISIFGPLMRDYERTSLSGLPFYALGAASSLIFYYEPFAVLSILFLIFADSIASAVGVSYGRGKIYGNKSLEGSISAFLCSFAIVMIYGLMYFPININLFVFALLSSLGCAIVELFSTRLDDNLTIPIFTGGVMSFLDMIIPMI